MIYEKTQWVNQFQINVEALLLAGVGIQVAYDPPCLAPNGLVCLVRRASGLNLIRIGERLRKKICIVQKDI